MAGGSINWYVVIPDATRNLVSNPSFEFGTAGWAGTNTPTLGTSADDQQYGAWAAHMTGAAGTVGIRAPITGAVAGGTYTASAYVRMVGTSGGQARISLGGTSYTTTLGTAEGWTRISVGSIGAVGSVAVQRASGAAGTLWVDGVQVEAAPGGLNSLTTYIDGDQAGGVWEGPPHASPSYRGAQTRSGGTLVPLASIGFRPQETPDTGMWPVTNILQSYAVNAGAEYQRGRPTERTFTLMVTMTGTSLADQHVTRREVIDALKVERVTPPQPNRLYYTGATGTSYIDAYYDSGLGWGGANVVADEDAAVRFVATDPAWYGVAQEGTSLAPYTVLGSTNFIAYRDPEGRWGTLGAGNGTSVNGTVRALYANNGTLFAGGSFGIAGGTVARSVAQWAGGAWGTLTGGTLINTATFGASALYQSAAGTLFVGGDFTSAAGTTANRIAMWTTGGWGTLAHGSAMASTGLTVYDIAPRPEGGIYVGGEFDSAGGTQTRYVAQWAGAWGTLGPGTVDNVVFSVVPLSNGSIIIGGGFAEVAGTQARAVAQWVSTRGWGTLTGGTIANPGNTLAVIDLALAPDYSLYAGGAMAQPGTGVVRYRSSYTSAGTVVSSAVYPNSVRTLLALPNGYLYAGGVLSKINGVLPIPVGLALWNGYSWLPPDLIISTNADAVRALAQDASGTLYMGGEFRGIGTAASVTPVINSGIAESYPVLRLRNNASGTARVYQLLNTTTGDSLWFDYVMTPGEIATLVTMPGNRSFTSSSRGNIFGAIIGGSNIASWRLLPGTNTVSFFADNPSVQADLYWNPRHASIDGGAEAVL